MCRPFEWAGGANFIIYNWSRDNPGITRVRDLGWHEGLLSFTVRAISPAPPFTALPRPQFRFRIMRLGRWYGRQVKVARLPAPGIRPGILGRNH